jgi:hypothetical protein
VILLCKVINFTSHFIIIFISIIIIFESDYNLLHDPMIMAFYFIQLTNIYCFVSLFIHLNSIWSISFIRTSILIEFGANNWKKNIWIHHFLTCMSLVIWLFKTIIQLIKIIQYLTKSFVSLSFHILFLHNRFFVNLVY